MQKVINTERKKRRHLGRGGENGRRLDDDLIQIVMFLLEMEAD